MIHPAVIKRYKLDPEALKKFFVAREKAEGVTALISLVRERVRDGRTRNLMEYRTWAAVDAAFDTPFQQTTPTLLKAIAAETGNAQDILSALRAWGLPPESMMTKEELSPGVFKWELNAPLFYNVFVPFVRSYCTIRVAKIFNDRNLVPLLNYQPKLFTSENRILCQILTEIVESLTTNYGYPSVMRDFIFNAMMYSVSLMFPVESWSKVECELPEGGKVVEREGIRYYIPHITRTFYDLTYPLRTMNTGTGCAYAGYWTIVKYGDVRSNTLYWNTMNIPHGTNWLDPSGSYRQYFAEVYPCTLEFPKLRSSTRTDREAQATRYGRNNMDSALFLTYVFMEINPSDFGISEYSKPIWFRFTVASDDTIIYAEAWPYRPVNMACYDGDSGRAQNASLALEIIPFQDIVGNVLTNYIQTVKRNLANIIFYDTDIVDEEQLRKLKSNSNWQYANLNFIGFSGMKVERQGKSMDALFKEVKFQYANTADALQAINTIISMLERLLVVSAQEIGAAASHQQSKKEVEIVAENTSNRVAYTASFIDDGIYAWKRQLYEAVMCFMDGNDAQVSIPSDFPNLEANLQKLGFSVVEGSHDGRKVTVKGKIAIKTFLQLVSRRTEIDRQADTATAQAMFQAIAAVANNPTLAQIVQPTSIVHLIETAARLLGADSDFQVGINQQAVMSGELQKAIGQIQQQLMANIEKEVIVPATKEIAAQSSAIQSLSQQLEQIKVLVSQMASQPPVIPPIPPTGGQTPVTPAPAVPPA